MSKYNSIYFILLEMFTFKAHSSEFDHSLRLRLKNDLKIVEHPSACESFQNNKCQSGEIQAWVQGFMFDYKTENLTSFADVDVFGYSVQKLLADPEKTMRFYLNGHDGMNFFGASLNLKPIDDLEIKLGRFGVDRSHGHIKHIVPLLEYSSVRTIPAIKEGAMFHY